MFVVIGRACKIKTFQSLMLNSISIHLLNIFHTFFREFTNSLSCFSSNNEVLVSIEPSSLTFIRSGDISHDTNFSFIQFVISILTPFLVTNATQDTSQYTIFWIKTHQCKLLDFDHLQLFNTL
jgi:hypothetical protein